MRSHCSYAVQKVWFISGATGHRTFPVFVRKAPMKNGKIRFAAYLLMSTAFLGSCYLQKKGPVEHKSSELNSEGNNLRAEGETQVKEGMTLQHKAQELRLVAEDTQRQASTVETTDPSRAASLL